VTENVSFVGCVRSCIASGLSLEMLNY